MNDIELIKFTSAHPLAGRYMMAAVQDYAACRCCLLNGLFSGLRLGSEAVEKYLKAFLYYANPGSRARYRHDIKGLARFAATHGFDIEKFAKVMTGWKGTIVSGTPTWKTSTPPLPPQSWPT